MLSSALKQLFRRGNALTLMLMIAIAVLSPVGNLVSATSDCPSGLSALDCEALNYGWVDWVPNACSQNGGSVQLVGNDNLQKIFNYFASNGFTQPQAAGIVGNVYHESRGGDPLAWEGGGDKQIPPDPNNPKLGWGIVQWTPANKILNYGQYSGETPGDLSTQVEFLLKQLDGTAPFNNEKPAGDALKQQTNAYDAAITFMNYYERPANPQQDGPPRGQTAEQALALYGSSSQNGSSSPSSSCGGGVGCDGSSGQYAALVSSGANFARIDQGIDFVPANSSGYDICAPASGTITQADQTGHHFDGTPGQAEIIEKLDQSPGVPNSSQYIYYAEIIQIASTIQVGTHVNAGEVIGHNAQSPGIEVGWADPSGNGNFLCGLGLSTPCGTSFNSWILELSSHLGQGGSGCGGGNGAGSFLNTNPEVFPGVQVTCQRAAQMTDTSSALFHQWVSIGYKGFGCNNGPDRGCPNWCDFTAAFIWGYGNSGYSDAQAHWDTMVAEGHAHPGDRNPPLGALLFYDNHIGSGHIVIYLGNNTIISSDWNAQGQDSSEGDGYVGIIPADKMENVPGGWGLTYLGWSDPVFAGSKLP